MAGKRGGKGPGTKGRSPTRAPAPRPEPARADVLPTKADIIAFLRDTDAKAGKREIARAFGIRGEGRIALKALLREMAEEGLIDREGARTLSVRGEMPPVAPLDIVGRDTDGELLCRPVRWQGEGPPPPILLAPREGAQSALPAIGVGDRILARIERPDPGGPYIARFLKAIGAGAPSVIGVFRSGRGKRDPGTIEPADRRQRTQFTVAPGDAGEARDGDLVIADVAEGRGYGPRRARVRECLGSLSEPRNISLIAIHAHGLPTEFSARAIEEAESARPASAKGRTDLTHIPLVTIDPSDARDHDDAVHARPDPEVEGGFYVTVAIADVAHYVRPGSALDAEARERGNSAYFPDRVIPMLPEALSADLCSLMPGESRPCLAVEMRFDAGGGKRSHTFVRGLMRSAGNLTYEEVQAAIDGRPNEKTGPLLEPILRPLYEAYGKLAAARERRGPLELDLPERKVELDADGRVRKVGVRERLDAHRLIEECMILANVCAAETLERRNVPLLYRVHAPPDTEKLAALADYLGTLGLSSPIGRTIRPSFFNHLIARAGENRDVVSEVILRSQSQAVYAPENIGHFGLNLRRYAHFTSPIRRYSDLIVHRGLIRALDLGADGLGDDEIETLGALGEALSAAERRAMAAERDSTDRYLAAFMAEREGEIFEGRISGVTRFGLFVRLAETGADGLVPIATLGNEYFFHDEGAHALVGERTGSAFRLGESVMVRLEEATPVTGGLRFSMESEPTPGEGERGARSPSRMRRPSRPGKSGPRRGPPPRKGGGRGKGGRR